MTWFARLTSGANTWASTTGKTTIESDLAAVYSLGNVVTSDLTAAWYIGKTVQSDFSAAFAVNLNVVAPTTWFARLTGGANTWAGGSVDASLGTISGSGTLPIIINSDLTAAYSVNLTAYGDLGALWSIRTSVYEPFQAQWNVLSGRQSDLTAAYDVNTGYTAVGNNYAVVYDITKPIQSDFVVVFQNVGVLTGTAQADYAPVYQILSEISGADLVSEWNLYDYGAESDLVAVWSMKSAVPSDLTAVYQVAYTAKAVKRSITGSALKGVINGSGITREITGDMHKGSITA